MCQRRNASPARPRQIQTLASSRSSVETRRAWVAYQSGMALLVTFVGDHLPAWAGVVLETAGRPGEEDHDEEDLMATGETGFDDVSYDLISVQYHSLKAGHDYGQYVRDARNAGRDDIASFFEQVMKEDSDRATRCHDFLKDLTGSSQSGPAMS